MLNLIIEVSGEKLPDKDTKMETVKIEVSGEKLPDKDSKMEKVKNMWVPAVNNTGQFGRFMKSQILIKL
ncbi:MAG: hypothetical protein DRR19_29230 [Candidatus Parabeggiatoa sp. nov. 1]|nr:MAG: hypothetical protein DRR19_29230 [Gammaproteobacteria bacterium]